MYPDHPLANLEESAELLKALLKAAVDAIMVIDPKGCVLIFNDSAERLFGYRREQVLGRNVSMLMPNPYRDEHDGYIERYERTRRARIIGIGREVRALDADGVEFPIDLAVGEAQIAGQRLYVGIVRDLRQRAHLEIRLRQERRRAERLFDLAQVFIAAIDGDGQIRLLNRHATDVLGADRIGTPWCDGVTPADRPRVQALIRDIRSLQSREAETAEYAIRGSSSGVRQFAWQHQWAPPGETDDPSLILISGVDVTEVYRIAQQLRVSEQSLRQLFDQAPVGILRLNERGNVVSANQALCEMLDISSEVLHQHTLSDIFKPDIRHRDRMPGVGQPATLGVRECQGILTWGERSLRVTVTIGPVRSGVRDGHILHIVDRSAQLAAEAEAGRLRDRLAHAQRLGLMGEMAAGIAHEINQPLSAIASFSDGAKRFLAADPRNIAKVDFALEQIGSQSRRAGDVVRRMRALARRETTERKKTDINRLIRDLLNLVEPEARHLEAQLILELDDSLPLVVVDEVQIQQVVLNLTRNALDALATRSQAQRGVRICTRLQQETILVCVIDHGVGVPKESSKRIFDPFFSSKPSGMGMGLSICATIVRTHGGRLWYDDNEGGGSCFQFTLPVETVVAAGANEK